MLKALILKQLKELLFLYTNKRRKSKHSIGKTVTNVTGAVILIAIVFVSFFSLFYVIMSQSCKLLCGQGNDWLYFAISCLMGVVLSVIGSVFMAQSQLFAAKDNELLLAMPIPPSTILLSRMISLYLQNFVFTALVFIPTATAYWKYKAPGTNNIICFAVLLFISPLFSLVLTCILGWAVALITSRMRNKNIITIVLSLGFIVAYYYFYMRMNFYINLIAANSESIGASVKSYLYPIYKYGLAAAGDYLSLLIYTAIISVSFAIIYFLLSVSFIKIVTTKRGAKKVKYREKELKVGTAGSALFRKDLKRFLNSSVYFLNCGLGALILLAMAVFAFIKADYIGNLIKTIFGNNGDIVAMIGTAMISLIVCTSCVSAVAISIEGKSMWLMQSLPVSPKQIIWSKLKLHVAVTGWASLIASVAVAVIAHASFISTVMIFLIPILLLFLVGILGILLNLRYPKLDWTNEAVAVKQSISVVFTMLIGYGILLVPSVAYIAFAAEYISPELMMVICAVVFAVITFVLYKILFTKGVTRFKSM